MDLLVIVFKVYVLVDVVLVILGDGFDCVLLENFVVGDLCIWLLGFWIDVDWVLLGLDLFVLVLWEEVFLLVILEVMCVGWLVLLIVM